MHVQIPSHLSDADLITEAKRLARSEREATACLVAHIVELEARALYLGEGFRSLFAYCHEVLELSEQSTYNRIEAARAARRFPVILDMLSEASLTLATVRLIAPHLNADNHEQLLIAASHKSKREVERLLARLFPQPDVADSVRKVRGSSAVPPPASPLASPEPQLSRRPAPEPPSRGRDRESAASLSGQPELLRASGVVLNPIDSGARGDVSAGPAACGPTQSPVCFVQARPPRQGVRPLSDARFEVRFTVPASTCEKLELAQDLLRHAVPTGDMADVVDRALTALLEKLAKQKYAATPHPRPGGAGERSRPSPGTRYIPSNVKRTVWLRDLGRCSFTSTAGRRCDARGFLEFHHVRPFAAGGPSTIDNIQLRCRAHNAHEADLYFGPHGGEEREWLPQLAPGQVGLPPAAAPRAVDRAVS